MDYTLIALLGLLVMGGCAVVLCAHFAALMRSSVLFAVIAGLLLGVIAVGIYGLGYLVWRGKQVKNVAPGMYGGVYVNTPGVPPPPPGAPVAMASQGILRSGGVMLTVVLLVAGMTAFFVGVANIPLPTESTDDWTSFAPEDSATMAAPATDDNWPTGVRRVFLQGCVAEGGDASLPLCRRALECVETQLSAAEISNFEVSGAQSQRVNDVIIDCSVAAAVE